MALRSVYIDGSSRGRPPSAAHHTVIARDAKGAYFATGRYQDATRFYLLSFEDGSITLLARLCAEWTIIALTSAGVALVSRFTDPAIALLDLHTGALSTREGAEFVSVSCVSSDARWVAIRKRASTEVNTAVWTELVRFEDMKVVASIDGSRAETFTSDGRALIAVDADGVVHCVDLADQTRWTFVGRVSLTFRLNPLIAERGGARVLCAFARREAALLDVSARTMKVVAWDEGATIQDFANGRVMQGCAVDGRRRGVMMRDLETGARRVIDRQSEGSVTMSSDGRWALEFAAPIFGLHDLETGEMRTWHDGAESKITALAWSRDGVVLASRDENGGVRVVNPRDGALVWRLEGPRGHPGSICFSPDGRSLYALSSQAFVAWDLATGEEVHRSTRIKQRAVSMSVSDDGRHLAVVGDDYTVRTLTLVGGFRRAMSAKWPAHSAYRVAFDTLTLIRCLGVELSNNMSAPVGESGPQWRHAAVWFDPEGRVIEALRFPEKIGPYVPIDDDPDGFVAARADALIEVRRTPPNTTDRVVRAGLARPRVLCASHGVAICEESVDRDSQLVARSLSDGGELGHFSLDRACLFAAIDPRGELIAIALRDGGVEVLELTR